ncbi:phosphotransferase [Cohnella caldifontis]|uniref:phosphotransferase n=1 Tax=Cohnella caldifontis TaxID=3027471 RepID=UPI0023ECCD77|nr:phosphotransferase [Cohnella sp. YIM B05605]
MTERIERQNDADVETLLAEFMSRGVLERAAWEIHGRRGTTEGRVFLLSDGDGPKYVLKLDEPGQIRTTGEFLRAYSGVQLFPRLLEVHPEGEYLVYAYREGSTRSNRGAKARWLAKITEEVLNVYEPERERAGWGRPEYPCESWREFNRRSLYGTRDDVRGVISLEDQQRIESLALTRLADEGPEAKYRLHGDLGAHNFVYDQEELVGIIDPDPMAGPILYDFTYAFCSTPDDLDPETLRSAYARLRLPEPKDERKLMEETAFQLYCRIGICLRHHPEDLEEYMTAWAFWRTFL